MTIEASIRPTVNCSRVAFSSWLGARTTTSKEPLRLSTISSGCFFRGLVTGRRRRDGHVDLVEQRLGIGGHCLLFFLEILILRFVVNHRPAIDSASSVCATPPTSLSALW